MTAPKPGERDREIAREEFIRTASSKYTKPGENVLSYGAAVAARARREALEAIPHDSGCPAVADDESDQVLADYQQCVCYRRKIDALLAEEGE